ncbi:MAG: hypothetical protein J0I23_31075 [Rhizobiales bacterium]|mgnify:CR=1 FL=1|nr:hypothetical protein [Hyphomicrobiales bacterium]
MSDTDQTPTHPAPPIHLEHWCCEPGCTEWGSLGHSPHKAIPPRWWCFRHFPDEYKRR